MKHDALLPTRGERRRGRTHEEAGRHRRQNILFIGSDARAGLAGARSDVIVLAHVPRDHKTRNAGPLPARPLGERPGHGKAKLNAAFAYGQTPLLVQTMQDLLGIPIDHVAPSTSKASSA